MNPHLSFLAAFAALLAVGATGGCHYFYDQHGEEKMIPSPLPASLPYEISGKLYRVWVGNEIQLQSGMQASYLILQGVNNPDSGDELEQHAIDFLKNLIGDRAVRATAYELDYLKRGIARVFVDDVDINLAMIKSGWGQYDGSEFADSNSFKEAQSQAKAAKLGIWKSK